MAWLNEFGVRAVASRTQDLDPARRQPLKLAAAISLLETLEATQIEFLESPGLRSGAPASSAKRPGREGLRVDLLTHGPQLGQLLAVPELKWHAQTIPHFDYLLQDARAAAMLAGGHCVPVQIPDAERMAWHKLYSSTRRLADQAKADKDLRQAATLLAVLVERDSADLSRGVRDAPSEVRRSARQRLPALEQLLAAHPQALDAARAALTRTTGA